MEQVLPDYFEHMAKASPNLINIPIDEDPIDEECDKNDEEEQEIKAFEKGITCKQDICDHPSFFRAISLNSQQIQNVTTELPNASDTNNLAIFCGFNLEMLSKCGLSQVQIDAWKFLINLLYH